MAFARVNGVVLHHELRGAEDAPAVVFSNSLGTDFRIWNEVADALSGGYRLLRYDKRGHGLSDAPPAPYAMTEHVEDLAALMNHVGIERAAIVGLSVGGLIAQGMAATHPDKVRALVLSNTAHKIGNDELWNTRIETCTSQGISAMAEGIMERWFTPAYRKPENADFAGYANMLVRTTVDGYAGTCAAIRDADLTESTRALELPVLCIVGDRDGATPPDLVRETAGLIEGARFEIIENAGHIPCVEKPAEMIRLIGEFLAALPKE